MNFGLSWLAENKVAKMSSMSIVTLIILKLNFKYILMLILFLLLLN